MDIRCSGWVMTVIIPAEHAPKPPPQRKQRSNRDARWRPPVAEHKSTEVGHGPIGPAVLEWNRPHVRADAHRQETHGSAGRFSGRPQDQHALMTALRIVDDPPVLPHASSAALLEPHAM